MAVVGRRGEKEAMLKPTRKTSDCLREIAVDGVSAAARGCRIVRLIENEHRAWPHLAELADKPLSVVSSPRRLWEMMKREPASHGLAAKQALRRTAARYSRSTMVKDSPNFWASSSCHWAVIAAGAETIM